MDKLKDMQLLCHIVEKGNFVKAAKVLGVTPAIVGRRVAAMEDALGFILFNRTTRSMQLTSVGNSYYQGAKQLLDQVMQLEESLTSQHQNNPSGMIRISAPDELGSQFLIQVIKEFNQSYPNIQFDLNMDNKPVNLIEEDIDLSFRLSFDMQDSSYIAVKLTSTTFGLYASPNYLAERGTPTHIDDLVQHDCLHMGSNRYGDVWHFEINGKAVTYRQPWKLVLSNSSALFQALFNDMGIGLLPSMFCKKHLENSRLVEIKDIAQFPKLGVYAMYPTRKHIPYRMTLFLNYIKYWFETNSL